MKITRNNVAVNLELSEFLSILEEDGFESLLSFIIELDEAMAPPAPPKLNPMFLKTAKPMNIEDLIQELDEMEDEIDELEREEYIVEDMNDLAEIFADILAHGGDFEIEYYEVDEDGSYGHSLDGLGAMFYDNIGDYSLSTEDKKVRRILNRYKDLME